MMDKRVIEGASILMLHAGTADGDLVHDGIHCACMVSRLSVSLPVFLRATSVCSPAALHRRQVQASFFFTFISGISM